MNKLIVVFSALIVAVSISQAANVSWKIGSDQAGKSYIAFVGDQSALIAALQDAQTYENDAGLASALSSDFASGTVADRGSTVNSAGVTDYITIVTVANGIADGKAFSYAVVDVSTMTYTPPEKKPGTFQISDGAWSSGTFHTKPIPEPCAVALLALGLAAFGLKRKVA